MFGTPVASVQCAPERTGLINLSLLYVLTEAATQDFILSTDAAEDHPLFVNKAIDSAPARRVAVWALVMLHFIVFATTGVCALHQGGSTGRHASIY